MRPTEDFCGPETLELLRAVLNEAWEVLTPEQQVDTFKSDMALRILRLAQQGERDPAKLRTAALLGVRRTSVLQLVDGEIARFRGHRER
jgi:hypothetical protein